MPDLKEDRDLADFFDSLLTDPTERTILKLILRGIEDDAIIEELLQSPKGEDTVSSVQQGKRP